MVLLLLLVEDHVVASRFGDLVDQMTNGRIYLYQVRVLLLLNHAHANRSHLLRFSLLLLHVVLVLLELRSHGSRVGLATILLLLLEHVHLAILSYGD